MAIDLCVVAVWVGASCGIWANCKCHFVLGDDLAQRGAGFAAGSSSPRRPRACRTGGYMTYQKHDTRDRLATRTISLVELCSFQSWRKARIGSTRDACRAGPNPARIATTISREAALARVS